MALFLGVAHAAELVFHLEELLHEDEGVKLGANLRHGIGDRRRNPIGGFRLVCMDVAYLLTLQGLREALGGGVEEAFVILSSGLLAVAFAVALLVYWLVDKRQGLCLLFSYSAGGIINQTIKNTLCVYRPCASDPNETIVPSSAQRTAILRQSACSPITLPRRRLCSLISIIFPRSRAAVRTASRSKGTPALPT